MTINEKEFNKDELLDTLASAWDVYRPYIVRTNPERTGYIHRVHETIKQIVEQHLKSKKVKDTATINRKPCVKCYAPINPRTKSGLCGSCAQRRRRWRQINLFDYAKTIMDELPELNAVITESRLREIIRNAPTEQQEKEEVKVGGGELLNWFIQLTSLIPVRFNWNDNDQQNFEQLRKLLSQARPKVTSAEINTWVSILQLKAGAAPAPTREIVLDMFTKLGIEVED